MRCSTLSTPSFLGKSVSRERANNNNEPLLFTRVCSMTMLISSGVSEKRKRQQVIELLFLPRVYHVLDNHHALCRSITSYSQTDLRRISFSIHAAYPRRLIETPKALPSFFQHSYSCIMQLYYFISNTSGTLSIIYTTTL